MKMSGLIFTLQMLLIWLPRPLGSVSSENGTSSTGEKERNGQIEEGHGEMALKQPSNSTESAAPTALRMKLSLTDLRNQEIPFITEFPHWVQVNLSDVGHDQKNPGGFVKVGCYRELTGFKEGELYNRTFRFVLQEKFQGINILCMLRFPTGLRVQYRFEFGDSGTYAFFTFGHNKHLTVATSRMISKFERENMHFLWWKGVIFVPCRYSTLVFHPHAVGEIFEFRIMDVPSKYVDKCSELEREYYY